ncbi:MULTISPECIES: GNAT family N-acetyltransferase [unclassified Actinopolyspora]|uniref:GNAT family N-acetyltransferase n=1 Tax=unclassified Actinopolyspora TaxID=2639451 RepID=UPI0013F63D18|nr:MULTISPECIES: GNAT family N-acetyltransferase [unclassified Actinopolyspora]NHD17741.1 GNAT family N-acetyltransferase [Actinopolyspora sp. BKK2]NHE76526.1 GNAT family N-acetyltransferase [Actinopolyspora sp. BKK1]
MSEAEKPRCLQNLADLGEQGRWSSARLSVRAAGDGDERTLAKIDHSTWSWEVAPVPLWPLEKPFFDDQTHPENVLVAEDQGQVVGYVKLRPASLAYRKAAAASRHVQQVHGFAVDRNCQGRGVGRLLLEAARQEAVRRKARRITLRVLSTNSRAQALYRAGGYHVEGVLEGEFFIQGQYVDDVLMALDLTAAK